MNGQIHGELKDPDLSHVDDLRRRLGLLDGVNRYSFGLWRLPEKIPFTRINLRSWPQEYLQAAGSQTAMTIEIRRIENDTARQYVVGRPTSSIDEIEEVSVPWNGCEARVRATEVFDGLEAIEIFIAYYETGDIPETYETRLL